MDTIADVGSRAARNERECVEAPATRRFVVQTPIYDGPNDSVSFAENTITVTAQGRSATDEAGNPEAWFDPVHPMGIIPSAAGGGSSARPRPGANDAALRACQRPGRRGRRRAHWRRDGGNPERAVLSVGAHAMKVAVSNRRYGACLWTGVRDRRANHMAGTAQACGATELSRNAGFKRGLR